MQRLVIAAALCAAVGSSASAQSVVRFGEDARVRSNEVVEDVVTMGGDAVVRGHVTGDVATMGGDVRIVGEVDGDVVTMGGDVEVEGTVHGTIHSSGGTVELLPGAQLGRGVSEVTQTPRERGSSKPLRYLMLLLLALGL
ncbi:MAG: polymer-forming cytoskeletal protein, partial [Myxococcota bacterium]